jgi:hypothetical protein
MAQPSKPDLLRALIDLDGLVDQARADLQETTESHPQLERRIKRLVRLVARRDRLLAAAGECMRRTAEPLAEAPRL